MPNIKAVSKLAMALLGASAALHAAPAPCVDVEVNGYRGLSYDCLGQQLAGPGTPRPHANASASELATRRAPNQLGLANPASTSNRMGTNFGRSAFPQRPPVPIYTAPMPGPRQ